MDRFSGSLAVATVVAWTANAFELGPLRSVAVNLWRGLTGVPLLPYAYGWEFTSDLWTFPRWWLCVVLGIGASGIALMPIGPSRKRATQIYLAAGALWMVVEYQLWYPPTTGPYAIQWTVKLFAAALAATLLFAFPLIVADRTGWLIRRFQ